MTGRGRHIRVDLDRPRKITRTAEELLVEVVAPASDRLRQRKPGDDRIEQRRLVPAIAANHPETDEHTGSDTARDAEAAFPDLERLRPTLVEAPVGEDVVGASADQPGGHRPERDGRDVVGIAAAAAHRRCESRTAATTPKAIITP